MGEPTRGNAWVLYAEHIGVGGAPRELKHLSTARKRENSLSSGERKGTSPNPTRVRLQSLRVGGSKAWRSFCRSSKELQICLLVEWHWKGQPERVIAP